MTDQNEFAGKTIEEALELAATDLAADAESIEYKLLETPKRFFFMGGSKEYRIRVLKFTPVTGGAPVISPPAPPRPAQPAPPARPARPQPPAAKAEPVAEPRRDRQERQPRPERQPRQEREPRQEQQPRQEREPRPSRQPKPEAEVETAAAAAGSGEDELDRIIDLVDEFIDCWGMNLEMEVETTDECLEINFFGDDQHHLLEKKGAGLLSLQLILGKMLYKQGLISRKLQVDCQGYRLRRENELREIAGRMADRVKSNGEDALLNPLNPYERRIVHLALVEDDQVTTESQGDGYMKKIRVIRT